MLNKSSKGSRRISTIIFFIFSYAFTILTFSVGISAINSQKLKVKKSSGEYNKNLIFQLNEDATEEEVLNKEEILNILEKEKVSTILKRSQNKGNIVETYAITNGELYKEDMKKGEYFTKEDFKSDKKEAVFSNTFAGTKELELNDNGMVNKVKFNEERVSYEKEPKVTVPVKIFEKFQKGIDFNDPTMTVVINGEKEDLNKTINNLNTYLKNNTKNFSLKVYDYIIYDREAEWNALLRTTALIIFVTLINSIGIAFLWIESRKKEIILRKVVGANNLDVGVIFFKELFRIAIVAMVIALILQYMLSTITDGYVLDMNIKMSFSNVVSSFFITMGATLVTSIPFFVYLTRIQPVEMLREE